MIISFSTTTTHEQKELLLQLQRALKNMKSRVKEKTHRFVKHFNTTNKAKKHFNTTNNKSKSSLDHHERKSIPNFEQRSNILQPIKKVSSEAKARYYYEQARFSYLRSLEAAEEKKLSKLEKLAHNFSFILRKEEKHLNSKNISHKISENLIQRRKYPLERKQRHVISIFHKDQKRKKFNLSTDKLLSNMLNEEEKLNRLQTLKKKLSIQSMSNKLEMISGKSEANKRYSQGILLDKKNRDQKSKNKPYPYVTSKRVTSKSSNKPSSSRNISTIVSMPEEKETRNKSKNFDLFVYKNEKPVNIGDSLFSSNNANKAGIGVKIGDQGTQSQDENKNLTPSLTTKTVTINFSNGTTNRKLTDSNVIGRRNEARALHFPKLDHPKAATAVSNNRLSDFIDDINNPFKDLNRNLTEPISDSFRRKHVKLQNESDELKSTQGRNSYRLQTQKINENSIKNHLIPVNHTNVTKENVEQNLKKMQQNIISKFTSSNLLKKESRKNISKVLQKAEEFFLEKVKEVLFENQKRKKLENIQNKHKNESSKTKISGVINASVYTMSDSTIQSEKPKADKENDNIKMATKMLTNNVNTIETKENPNLLQSPLVLNTEGNVPNISPIQSLQTPVDVTQPLMAQTEMKNYPVSGLPLTSEQRQFAQNEERIALQPDNSFHNIQIGNGNWQLGNNLNTPFNERDDGPRGNNFNSPLNGGVERLLGNNFNSPLNRGVDRLMGNNFNMPLNGYLSSYKR